MGFVRSLSMAGALLACASGCDKLRAMSRAGDAGANDASTALPVGTGVRPDQTPPASAPPPHATGHAPSSTTPTPAAQVGGIVPGRYQCGGIVGRAYVLHGEFRILSPSTYTVEGDGVQRYALDPTTNKVTWQSGIYADGTKFRDARYVPARNLVTMRAGKDGFYTWDCFKDGKF